MVTLTLNNYHPQANNRNSLSVVDFIVAGHEMLYNVVSGSHPEVEGERSQV